MCRGLLHHLLHGPETHNTKCMREFCYTTLVDAKIFINWASSSVTMFADNCSTHITHPESY